MHIQLFKFLPTAPAYWINFSIFLMIGFSLCPELNAQHPELRKEIDKIIRFDTEIDVKEHEGFVIAIIDHDSTYVLNYGQHAIDTFDLFELGGVSKVFTANLVTALVETGKLDYKKKINDYLPSQFQNEYLKEYSIEDLLMHQIPFPKRPSDLSKKEFEINNPYAFYTKLDVLNYYQTFIPPKKSKRRREILHYSHISYALLEIIIESVLKMPYEEALQHYILADLDMNHTSASFPSDSITSGFNRAHQTTDPWKFQSFKGSEGVVSDLNDLIHYVRLNIELSENPITNLLLESQKVQKKSKISDKLSHSYAWYILDSKKTGPIYTHSGSTNRHKVYLHFKPDSKTGVIILSRSNEGTGELGMLILRMINYNWK